MDDPGGDPASAPDALRRTEAVLAARGRRTTRAVRRVVAVLGAAPQPLTVREVVDAARLPPSSAYRIVGDLVLAGVLDVVRTVDRSDRYELSERIAGEHHHHLLCTACGAVEDYRTPAGLEAQIEAVALVAASARGWRVGRHNLDLLGLCGACASVTRPPTGAPSKPGPPGR